MSGNYVKVYLIIVGVLLAVVFFNYQNNNIKTSTITYKNSRIPDNFNQFTIIQITDLHNKKFGNKQIKLLKKIRDEKPDIIVVTGDIIDRRRFDLLPAIDFIKGAQEIAPVYYSPGNHEAWSFKYDEVDQALSLAGAVVLNNESEKIVINGESIDVIGLKDAAFDTLANSKTMNLTEFKKHLDAYSKPKVFSILLSHRPEIFKLYSESEIDLVFSGHAHGGQIRLPFIGPLFAPNQGMFPKYTSGVYKREKTSMVVSRGLGNSLMPMRLFNQPEIVKVVLQKEK